MLNAQTLKDPIRVHVMPVSKAMALIAQCLLPQRPQQLQQQIRPQPRPLLQQLRRRQRLQRQQQGHRRLQQQGRDLVVWTCQILISVIMLWENHLLSLKLNIKQKWPNITITMNTRKIMPIMVTIILITIMRNLMTLIDPKRRRKFQQL